MYYYNPSGMMSWRFLLAIGTFLCVLRVTEATQRLPFSCEKINLVYTWVNGSEAKHHESLVETSKRVGRPIAANRFRDMDGLLYSLRSIEKNARWIDKVFLITADQVPSYLNIKNPRIKIIPHREFFAHQEHLPTFSSNAIEANFVNLPDYVGPCFVYLNDDMFFANEVFASDFWAAESGQLLYQDAWVAPAPQDVQDWDPWHKSVANSNAMLDRLFAEKATREYPAHGPYFFSMEVLRAMRSALFKDLNRTSSHPFREDTDTAFPFLYHHFTKHYYHSTLSSNTLLKWQGLFNDAERVCAEVKNVNEWRPKVLCFNDQMEEADPQVIKCATDFMRHMFPDNCSLEVSA